MKKKNWLLTIAFAVLALTIVSTTVLGGTYAKFVSTVSGSAQAQAAGFLVTGSASRSSESDVLLAPGVTVEVSAGITSYFSQVVTDITVVNEVSSGTGIFTTENWNALVAYYNQYVAKSNDVKALVDDGQNGTRAVTISDIFTVYGGTTAASIAEAIYEAGVTRETPNDKTSAITATVWNGTYTAASNQLPAMKADATAALSLTGINLSLTWQSLTYTVQEGDPAEDVEYTNDDFDTFVGNCIYALATTSSNSTVDVMTVTVAETPHTLTLTVGDGTGAAAYHTSTLSTSVVITATQHIATPVEP